MKKEIIYCDRCGKECEDYIKGGYVAKRKYRLFRTFYESLDLCDKCYEELNEWLSRNGKPLPKGQMRICPNCGARMESEE